MFWPKLYIPVVKVTCKTVKNWSRYLEVRSMCSSSGSTVGLRGHGPKSCKISHKKDGHKRQLHRIYVSQPPSPATESTTVFPFPHPPHIPLPAHSHSTLHLLEIPITSNVIWWAVFTLHLWNVLPKWFYNLLKCKYLHFIVQWCWKFLQTNTKLNWNWNRYRASNVTQMDIYHIFSHAQRPPPHPPDLCLISLRWRGWFRELRGQVLISILNHTQPMHNTSTL